MIKNAGFDHVEWEDLTFGVCAIHSGFKKFEDKTNTINKE
jgi:ubiquinone/menaquinone biosynthesis C-methylase UbiE